MHSLFLRQERRRHLNSDVSSLKAAERLHPAGDLSLCVPRAAFYPDTWAAWGSSKQASAWGPGVGTGEPAQALCPSRSTRRLSASSYASFWHFRALGITHSLLKLSLALSPSCPPSPGFLLPLWMVFSQLLRFSPCLKKRSPPPPHRQGPSVAGPLSSNCCPRAGNCSTFIPGQTLPLALFLYLPTAPLRYHWARQTASRVTT